jgi:hypothetical protein
MGTLDANEARRWRKSSFSYNDDCVECRHERTQVQVRDSKNCDGPALSVSPRGWAALLTFLP